MVELRHGEQRQMQEYLALRSGHMEFLVRALDGNPEAVQQPDLPPLPTTVQLPMAQKAAEFLRRTSLPIEPRKQWASRLPIPEQHRAQTGRALCAWGDGGWARLVRSGKYEHNHFSDELVVESIKLIREWSPQTGARMGNLRALTEAPYAGQGICRAAGYRVRTAVPGGLGQDRRQPGAEGDGQQRAAGPQRRGITRCRAIANASRPGALGG